MIDLNEALNRANLIGIAAVQSLGGNCDGKPYFNHVQGAFPYWTWRVGPDEITDAGEEFDVDTYTLIGRLVIGHRDEGYKGEPESTLYTVIPAIKQAFNENPGLVVVDTAYPQYADEMTDLVESRLGRLNGFQVFMNSGLSAVQVGCEFPLTCKFETELDYT